jgi:hypothetical protein
MIADIDDLLILIGELAPELPINQDEQGGCVWCAKAVGDLGYGYAGKEPDDHFSDCPWLKAQKVLEERKRVCGRCETPVTHLYPVTDCRGQRVVSPHPWVCLKCRDSLIIESMKKGKHNG